MKRPKKSQSGGFTRAEINAMRRAQDRSESSTPKAVVEAFAPDAEQIGNVILQPCRGTHIILLTKTRNSLLGSDDPDRFLLDDLFQALAILSLPAPEARALVQAKRLEERAAEIADLFPVEHLATLAKRLNDYIVGTFKTLVPHGQKGGGGGNFRGAPAVATATAG